MANPKCYITLEGGLIQSVYSTIEGMDVIIIDNDIPDLFTDEEEKELNDRQAAFDADFDAGKLAINY